MIQTIYPKNWIDYELIDCGNFEKLERFGKYILIRPEPQAVWDKSLNDKEWEKRAHVKFIGKSPTSGTWNKLKEMPDRWTIQYPLSEQHVLTFRLALTSFKHVGIFPEQAANWDFIYQSLIKSKQECNVLNLFAYTGGATLAAKVAGAQVSHLDSVKQVVTWSSENMTLSGLNNIRWIVEDAPKFCKREEKRNNKYQGIILDPPAFGHGANGESWKLERDVNELLKTVKNISDPNHFFLVFNTYSLGFSAHIVSNLFTSIFGNDKKFEFGELTIVDSFKKHLPLGVYVQYRSF